MSCYKGRLSAEDGFSLMELAMVLVIAGIAVTITAGIMDIQIETFVRIFSRNSLVSDARSALRYMQVDFREIDPDNILTMQDNHFVFTDLRGNTVDWQYGSGTLTRNSQTMLSDLQSAPFAFLDSTMTPTTDSGDLYCVSVTLSLLRDAESLIMGENLYARN